MTHDPQSAGPTSEPESGPMDRPYDSAAASPADELAPEEEPTTTGTLFIMVLFLMAIAGMWGIMYFMLLSR